MRPKETSFTVKGSISSLKVALTTVAGETSVASFAGWVPVTPGAVVSVFQGTAAVVKRQVKSLPKGLPARSVASALSVAR